MRDGKCELGKANDALRGEGEAPSHQAATRRRALQGRRVREQHDELEACAVDELREAELRYRTLFEQSPDGILIIDTEGTLIEFNEAAHRQLGYSREEFARLRISDLDPVESPEEIEESIRRVLSEGKAEFDVMHRTKDGEIRHVHVITQVITLSRQTVFHTIWHDITERKQMEAELRALSLTDELTGLHNWRGFATLAKQQAKIANRLNRGLLLLYIDLDGLKAINDTFGHGEGNVALINTANVLKESFRESDITGRIGGDEFVVLAIEAPDDTAGRLITRLHENFAAFNAKSTGSYKLSVSVGAVRHDPQAAYSIDELLVQADKMMYAQKKGKKETY